MHGPKHVAAGECNARPAAQRSPKRSGPWGHSECMHALLQNQVDRSACLRHLCCEQALDPVLAACSTHRVPAHGRPHPSALVRAMLTAVLQASLARSWPAPQAYLCCMSLPTCGSSMAASKTVCSPPLTRQVRHMGQAACLVGTPRRPLTPHTCSGRPVSPAPQPGTSLWHAVHGLHPTRGRHADGLQPSWPGCLPWRSPACCV